MSDHDNPLFATDPNVPEPPPPDLNAALQAADATRLQVAGASTAAGPSTAAATPAGTAVQPPAVAAPIAAVPMYVPKTPAPVLTNIEEQHDWEADVTDWAKRTPPAHLLLKRLPQTPNEVTVDMALQGYLAGAVPSDLKSEVRPLTSAMAIMDLIRQRYTLNLGTLSHRLDRQWSELKQLPGESVAAFITRTQQLAKRLGTVNIQIGDVQLHNKILHRLADEYTAYTVNIKVDAAVMGNLDEIRQRLMQYESASDE
jgi:gag-polypeptide of LTR copia-type